jgi:hypothetical protein
VEIGAIDDAVRDRVFNRQLIYRGDKDDLYYLGAKAMEIYFGAFKARIVFIGDDGKEQHWYFSFFKGRRDDQFIFITADDSDWRAQWERTDAAN